MDVHFNQMQCSGIRHHRLAACAPDCSQLHCVASGSPFKSQCRRSASSNTAFRPAPENGCALGATNVLPRRHRRAMAARAAYSMYPFDESEYHKAAVSLVITAGAENTETVPTQGTVLLSKQQQDSPGTRPHALVLYVGGDTLHALSQLLQGLSSARPMALDLLWQTKEGIANRISQILERGQQISESFGGRSKWRLVRMTICTMQHQVYHGRLYFGDVDSGEVVWDCDCRPSDGFWLAMKSACPIYIKRGVWDECATEIETDGGGTLEDALKNFRAIRFGPKGTLRANPEEELSGTALLTTVRISDPDIIKRLKREMHVALSEEDFKSAVRIRDHPWMQLYQRIQAARSLRNDEEARELAQELMHSIEEHEKQASERRLPNSASDADRGGGESI